MEKLIKKSVKSKLKCILKYFSGFLLLLFIITIAYSRQNNVEGKFIFESKCLQCHKNGGEANIIAPSINASRQWNRFFKKNKHNRRYKDISSLFSSVELDNVKSYLIEHAADSPKPQAFGLK